MKREFTFIETVEVYSNKKYTVLERLLITNKGHCLEFIIEDKKHKALLGNAMFKDLKTAKLYLKGLK